MKLQELTSIKIQVLLHLQLDQLGAEAIHCLAFYEISLRLGQPKQLTYQSQFSSKNYNWITIWPLLW